MKSTSTRCALLDELRGLDLISMMLYHGMWDLVYLFGVRAPWYGSWQGELWQQSIRWVFILLSGFCLPLGWLGRNSLMLYLLHQPVIYGVLTVVFLLLRRGGGAL